MSELPFKVGNGAVVILKALPALQCENCQEILIEDHVMQRVEELLAAVRTDVELEVLRYAA